MADIPQAPLEGTSAASTEERPMLFMTEDDGAAGLRAALFTTTESTVTNGQRLGVLSIGVDDGNDTVAGATTDAAVTTDVAGTLSAKLRGLVKWCAERMPANLGQTTMAASLPVVVASDQSDLEVVGAAAENAAASGNPVLVGGRYDNGVRTLDDGDVGALALDSAGRLHVVGQQLDTFAVVTKPFMVAGRYDSMPRTISDGGAGIFATDVMGRIIKSVPVTPNEYNVTLTNADQEYYQMIPDNCRRLVFRCRTDYDVRFAWTNNKVASPTPPYQTLKAGSEYVLTESFLRNKTLYLASSQAGVVVEIEAWT